MDGMIRFLGAIGIALSVSGNFAQDHGHLNIGAATQQQYSKLIFANGADFATNSLYVKTLTLATNGPYSGYYQGNITLTGLAVTEELGGPEPMAALLGTYIHAFITNVVTPPGGRLAWWESGATQPTISLASEEGSLTPFRISETDGAPGTEPYGHIHGRRFTATVPGLYAVTFVAYDAAMNGLTDLPNHMPSDPLTIYFQAGYNLLDVRMAEDGVRVRFVATLGFNWQLQSSDSLGAEANWTAVGEPVGGNDLIIEQLDDRARVNTRFYRLERLAP